MVSAASPSEAGIVRHVSRADASCGGQSPCYGSIQAAVNAAQPGDTVQIQAGSYVEQVSVIARNSSATNPATRIVIQADPSAPVGGVVLRGAVNQCAAGHAILIRQSRFVTIRGLTITGAGGAAIALAGGGDRNLAVHIERNRIVANGGTGCDGGITIGAGNVGTLIVNNLVLANGRNGIATLDGEGGPHTLVQNTIHGNGWNGVSATRSHVFLLINNAITGNGTHTGSTGGRVGREAGDGAATPGDRAPQQPDLWQPPRRDRWPGAGRRGRRQPHAGRDGGPRGDGEPRMRQSRARLPRPRGRRPRIGHARRRPDPGPRVAPDRPRPRPAHRADARSQHALRGGLLRRIGSAGRRGRQWPGALRHRRGGSPQ